MPEISKIKLPSGGVYDIKDATAREMISGGVSFIIAWSGTSTPVPANIPAGVTVTYQGTTYTGTMDADDAQAGAFYLVKSSTEAGVADAYDEYVPVGPDNEKTWEKIGDTQIDLSDVVTNVSLTKQTANVLGSSATFQVPKTNISFTGGTTDVALGEGTTFALTSGAVTFETASTDTFVKSVSAETGKNLVTTTVPNVTGNTSVTIPNVTSAGSAATWSFSMGTGADAETLIINGANGTAPTLGTALTATNTTLGTAITVATGATSTTGTGDAVVTGVTIGSSGTAITAMPNATVGTGITVGTNDKVTTVTSIGTGSMPSTAVTVSSKDEKTVLTSATDVAVTKGNS